MEEYVYESMCSCNLKSSRKKESWLLPLSWQWLIHYCTFIFCTTTPSLHNDSGTAYLVIYESHGGIEGCGNHLQKYIINQSELLDENMSSFAERFSRIRSRNIIKISFPNWVQKLIHKLISNHSLQTFFFAQLLYFTTIKCHLRRN